MPTLTKEDHDRAATFIASVRFPFPGQKDWPADNLTILNVKTPTRSITGPDGGPHYPDIVIATGSGDLREVAEIEIAVGPEVVPIWTAGSLAADTKTKTGVKHFFVYVPVGEEDKALALLKANDISFAGVRTWSVAADGAITITPILTTGDPKDHVPSVSAPR